MKHLPWILLLSFPALAAKVPKHGHAVPHAWEWECDHGYVQHRTECVKVKVPAHGVLTPDGHGWDCKEGYEKYRDECGKKKPR